MAAILQCPVRNCPHPLERSHSRLVCAGNHSFDIARSGYVNLLQPQDRRSKHPGDTTAAVAARRRLHDRGVTQPLLDGIAQLLAPSPTDTILDAGCGEGFYMGNLAASAGCQAHGIDISIPAIDLAARRFPTCKWIVANADRAIPYADKSFSAILSITARMNTEEFDRVLANDGRLLVAIAAPDDLTELRGAGRDRTARTVETFSGRFHLTAQTRVTTTADLDIPAIEDILLAIYRPLQSKPLAATRVTFSLDLLLFKGKQVVGPPLLCRDR